jgi:hypothetical protein
MQGYRLTMHVGFDFGEITKGSRDFKNDIMAIPHNMAGFVITILSCCC